MKNKSEKEKKVLLINEPNYSKKKGLYQPNTVESRKFEVSRTRGFILNYREVSIKYITPKMIISSLILFAKIYSTCVQHSMYKYVY